MVDYSQWMLNKIRKQESVCITKPPNPTDNGGSGGGGSANGACSLLWLAYERKSGAWLLSCLVTWLGVVREKGRDASSCSGQEVLEIAFVELVSKPS